MARLIHQTENYTDAEGPLFRGEFAGEPPDDASELVVVTYNLQYGEAVAEMIAAFQSTPPLTAADIILLQEMDEIGIETVARELGYNYVYYPTSIGPNGKNFGNAILSLWPIEEPAKLILPGTHPISGQQRTATRAIVRIGGEAVLVYSIRVEISTAPPKLRAGQVKAIVNDIPAEARHVIVGGDFNAVTGRGVLALVPQFELGELTHETAGLSPTHMRFRMRIAATDHLFTRGYGRLKAGVAGEVMASDHFPVWVRLVRVGK